VRRSARTLAWFALAIIVAFITVITMWPTPVDVPAKNTIHEVLVTLHQAGVPTAVNYSFVEAATNVLMFVPLGTALAFLLPPQKWWLAPLIGAATSSLIELTQLTFLPSRFATLNDVAANTAGALIGAALVLGVRRGHEHGTSKAKKSADLSGRASL
jgi:glycopeptide antibiotics resistance protein